jgi:hypothetical protein
VSTVAHVFTGVPVSDRNAAVGWYERFTGRVPELIPNEREAAWQLTESAWIYVIADPEQAGSALNTLLLDDLDSFLAGLADRGIDASPVEVIVGAVRRSTITDPDGNRLQIGTPLT